MLKAILFVTMIACVFASWDSTDRRREHLQAVHHREVSHAAHGKNIGRGRDSRQAHGQLESTVHGGGTVFHNKEFKRVKKGHNNKRPDAGRRDNQLRRLHSRKHYKH